ncbi:MAG: tRNA pseudouridine(38-40) synthase TruA [Syntrophus sp. (in: bacteria)]|nr:tRNA pseudouridine(38-40) synthase TruA [Syntrophus sp. (in: bacteria)]
MARRRNISLVVEYDGTNYHGWQCQPNGVTLQEVVQKKVEIILDHPVKIYAAGRTDAGVHAFGQVINFHTEKTIELVKLTKGLNSLLPADIRIKQGREVDESFHARYSAKSKSYIYTIFNRPYLPPFNTRYVWHIPYGVNSALMNETIQEIVGTHDFSSFKKKDEVYRNHEREVLRAGVKRRGAFIYIFIEATGFLRYMVRNIVGTLALVGSEKISKDDFVAILNSRDRVKAGPTAPPQGLFLRRIKY